MYRAETGDYSTGNQIVEALVKEAEPAVDRHRQAGRTDENDEPSGLDRNLLELMAIRGRNLTGYANRKSQLGLK